MAGSVVSFVDGVIANFAALAQGRGSLDTNTLLVLGFVIIALLLPCTALVMMAAQQGPAGNDPIPFTPNPDAAPAPRRDWSPDKKEKKLLDARLTQLRDKRPATTGQREAAYKAAVYPHRSWSDDSYTGTLRPHTVSPRRELPKNSRVQRPDYAADGTPMSEMAERMTFSRKIKKLSPAEIQKMRVAGRLGREVLDLAALAVRPGVTCDEIDTIVHEACIKRQCYPSPLNYMKFPKSVCTSVNEVICHGIPDAYELQKGDIINIDVTIYFDGHHADLNETYFVGGVDAVDQDSRRLVQTAYECLFKAIDAVKPGVLYRNLGGLIQPHAEENGCSIVRTYTGHGCNSLFHTAPNVPHYTGNKAVGIMAAGQTFTIEPMLNAGGYRDQSWEDGWTAVTQDGSRSAQFEHTLLVTEEGVEILTARLPTSRADVATLYKGEVI